MNSLHRSVWLVLGLATVVFHLGLIFSGLVPNLVSRPLHMALALPWALIFMARTPIERVSGYLLTAFGLFATGWIAWNHADLSDQYGYLTDNFQLYLAVGLLITVLEMARRAIGWPLPLVALVALCYGLYGKHIPGEFGYAGVPVESFLGTMTIAEGGLWGKLTGVSVGVVAIFVIFGAFLNAGEAGAGFMNVAAAAAGKLKGGTAKVSVISSALFGSISGSASANVASTGAITLPAMTKLGYPRALAGAVEAVASSGGQIMPPLMGAGAFVMVELTGVPYTGIMAAAILPALLYFFAVWMGINAFARRYELKGLAPEDQPGTRSVVITSLFFLVPFTVLLWAMFVSRYTPQYAACLAILAAMALLLIDKDFAVDWRKVWKRNEQALMNSGKQVAMIASIILCASIIIGTLGVTGLGVKITSLILSGSGGMLWPALLLTALACMVLGMEVPTTAAYVICVSVAGPALIDIGLQPLQAHLFVFWFALLSTITPPVCGAVFIAAGMVNENWLKVAAFAMALGIGLYLIPLGMIANPALITVVSSPFWSLFAAVKVGLALSAISYGVIAPFKPLLRAGLVVCGAILLFI
ncbi:Sialic acid TRAP transporter permease protein SiaT [Pseudovibrio axinellae]|uniref:Sialic acid TRAP transporter permease protein SiaT n=1 Tax=Pseudovibrio axinellae TaxID=989403 RepID=A0A165ZFJ7_9HYPH|nr:TRAP transporter fused permease subunit [Pseudovibrio axinellae]KZL19837.1 Sialic acid TRAP transporter permease protein SiaT [Pseudovibrio axinellae]SER39612.1 TRAP transporter, 4TM/12TM fusion protein [Pseudovibrio axinellae]